MWWAGRGEGYFFPAGDVSGGLCAESDRRNGTMTAATPWSQDTVTPRWPQLFSPAVTSREHYAYAASAAGRKGRGLLGRAGGLRGGKKEKKTKKMMKGKERDFIRINLRKSSF